MVLALGKGGLHSWQSAQGGINLNPQRQVSSKSKALFIVCNSYLRSALSSRGKAGIQTPGTRVINNSSVGIMASPSKNVFIH